LIESKTLLSTIPRVPGAEHTDLSVVIPVLNEAENLQPLYGQLGGVLDSLDLSSEMIFVDDGSTDGTYGHLKEIYEGDERVRVIRLRRNFGQTAAFSAGFDIARGEVIVTMDGDLQNDPADIPRLLASLDQGYDIVSGWRANRQDPFLSRRLPSTLANYLISIVTGVKLHDYGCSLKAYRREVLENVSLYGEMHRFIPALASWMGIRVGEVKVNHKPRTMGRSKYGIGRTIKVLLDLITVKFLLGYATRPIQIFGFLGLAAFGIGAILSIYLATIRLIYLQPIGDRPLLLLSVLLIVLGVQLITMGLLGEMVIRIYHEAQKKPTYVIREKLINHQGETGSADGPPE
jgi:glycosyltransferase involved in cell wall biosynthesis